MVAKPFGTFAGSDAIQGFWEKLIADGFSDVTYIDPEFQVVDETSVILKSEWTMNNACGDITHELRVMQNDGTMKLREDHFEAKG